MRPFRASGLSVSLGLAVLMATAQDAATAQKASVPKISLQRKTSLRYATLIRLESDPPGAEVYIDDQRFGRTPITLDGALRPGTHRLVMTLIDYISHTETIRVGRNSRHRVELRPDVPVEGINPLLPTVTRSEAPGADPTGPGRKTQVDRKRDEVAGGVRVFESSWQIAFLIGSGGKTLETEPGVRYFSMRLIGQRNFTRNLGVHLGLELAIAPDLEALGTDSSETGSMAGFAVETGIPFYVDRIGAHGMAVGLAGGLLSHGYGYLVSNGLGGVEESSNLRFIQLRLGAFVFYEYLPEAEHDASDTGFRVQATYWAHGAPAASVGEGDPARSFALDAGLVVRF